MNFPSTFPEHPNNNEFTTTVEVSVEELQQQLTTIFREILEHPLLQHLIKAQLDTLQKTELCLTRIDNTGKTVRTPVEISLLPIILSTSTQRTLEKLVYQITNVKRAIVESIGENKDLQEFLLDDLPEITKEIILANTHPLNDHVRLRYDTFSHPVDGTSVQIELNGGEPQGDIITATPFRMVQQIMELYLTDLGVPIQNVKEFISPETLPIQQVTQKISSLYAHHQKHIPQLPKHANVGFFAFRHPETRRPLNNLSNNEAELSVAYMKQQENIADACSFDPFDIAEFRIIQTPEGTFHIPVVHSNGKLMELHFIRRLHGEPMENAEPNGAWETLRANKPEVYYRFIGKEHPTYNPEGYRCFPWMWMNSLNPMMTDKKLDAIISDPALTERFQVQKSLEKHMLPKEAEELLSQVRTYIPNTYYLQRESEHASGLSEKTIQDIQQQRSKYVLKESTLMGYSGKGVHLGAQLIVQEIPEIVLRSALQKAFQIPELRQRITYLFEQEHLVHLSPQLIVEKTSSFLTEELQNTLHNCIWHQLIEYALQQGGAIIQERSVPQTFTALRTNSSVTHTLAIDECELGVDINPQTFGDTFACAIVRMSQEAKTNITGGYGCLGSTLSESTARRFVQLVHKHRPPNISA